MPELLFVSPRFLFPADEGGKIRTTQVLRGMKGGPFRIHLACPEPDARERAFEGELPSVCDTHSYWKRPASGPLHRLVRLRRLFHDLPVPVLDDDSRSARRLIEGELARKPDLIVFDFVHSSVLAPSELPVPSLLFTHNVEAEIFERHAKEARSAWKRRIFASQAEKMRRFEGECCRRHDHIVAVSERDAEQFCERYGRREVSVIPTGVDLEYFSYAEPGTSLEVVFAGALDWHANADGIAWLLDEVWDLVEQEVPESRLRIVGRNPNHSLRDRARGRRVDFLGFVDDIRPEIRGRSAYAIPLRVGGGTRMKVFEAMAQGTPIVSTSIGVEGLPVVSGEDHLRADDARSFAEALVTLLRDAELRMRLSHTARKLVETKFSFERAAHAFEAACLAAIQKD